MEGRVLFEVTVRMSNNDLRLLSQTPVFWNEIRMFDENQDWWFRRTEYLLPRVGDWKKTNKSLNNNGLTFAGNHDYSDPLLARILFEIGANPTDYSFIIMQCACIEHF